MVYVMYLLEFILILFLPINNTNNQFWVQKKNLTKFFAVLMLGLFVTRQDPHLLRFFGNSKFENEEETLLFYAMHTHTDYEWVPF